LRAVPSRRRPSIRARATLAVLAVATLSVVVVFAVFYVAWTRYTLSLRTSDLLERSRVIASGLDAGGLPGGAGDEAGVRGRLMRVEAGLIGAVLSVTDPAGVILFSTSDPGIAVYPVDELEAQGDAPGVSVGVLTLPGIGTVLLVATELDIPDRYLVAAQPIQEIDQAQGPVLALFGASALAALAAAWGVGVWLARRITAPIVRLMEGVRAVARGDWGHQVRVEGDDEVAELAGSFNTMSTRVADAYGAQKEFVGDVSHELRTPITSIRGFSEALLDGTITDPAAVEKALRTIHDEAGRIAELTRTLLTLADLDAGSSSPEARPVDTVHLAKALTARFEPRAAASGHVLEVGPMDGTPMADPERVLQAASILLENALGHTPAGSRVLIRARAMGAKWELSVDDSGAGIPDKDRDRVFGRFTRLDPSRASGGGSGLGLAICRRLVELMGGSVRVEDSELGGARVVISLPTADPGLNLNSTRVQRRRNDHER
jgi:signal transduction histidine kinase